MKRERKGIPNYDNWTVEDFAEDLRTNPRYQTYLQQYDAASVAKFIDKYAEEKHELYQNQDKLYSIREERRAEYLSAAEDFLQVILQKKLFNVQCLWRAGLIDLPEVQCGEDFEYFNEGIWDCPFIDPITEEELEVAQRFLLEEEDTTDPEFRRWQDYEGFKVWDNEGDDDDDDEDNEDDNDFERADVADTSPKYYGNSVEIPDFYIYYDEWMKTGHLFDLPDHYWAKRKYYWDALRAESARKYARYLAEKGNAPPPLPSFYSRDKEGFIEACEDAKTLELMDLQGNKDAFIYRHELTEDLEFLLQLHYNGEKVALLPHTNWYDGVVHTVEYIKRKKTAEMLPYAYQTYMLAFDDDDLPALMAKRRAQFNYDESDDRNWVRQTWANSMEEAKALLGEV